MFKLIKKILSLVSSLIILAVAVLLISQLALTPSAERVYDKFSEEENISVAFVDLSIEPENLFMEDILSTENVQSILKITDGRTGVSSYIIYYDSLSSARDRRKEFKNEYKKSYGAISYRGKAVFIGSDEIHKDYRKMLF